MTNTSEVSQILIDWSVVFYRRSMHEFIHFIRQSGLSFSQINVLTHIYYHCPCEIAPLIEILEVSKAGAGQLLDRMDQQGLIERHPSPTDRRAWQVYITEEGKKMVEASITARQGWMKDLLDEVPADQRSQVAQSLQMLTRAARELETREWE